MYKAFRSFGKKIYVYQGYKDEIMSSRLVPIVKYNILSSEEFERISVVSRHSTMCRASANLGSSLVDERFECFIKIFCRISCERTNMCRRAMRSIHAPYHINVTRNAVKWVLLLGAREDLKEVQ